MVTVVDLGEGVDVGSRGDVNAQTLCPTGIQTHPVMEPEPYIVIAIHEGCSHEAKRGAPIVTRRF